MFLIRASLVISLLTAVTCEEDLDFPPGFLFGAGTSAYQVEGGWNASDKGESIWDRFVHENPNLIEDGSTGDVACDSYRLWRRDVEMVSDLGLHFYRISISWPRLLPTGFGNKISEDGLNYYNNIINGLLAKGVQPMITLYHWDLPQNLEDLGGWTNPLIVDWFGDYARVAYNHFGDRVTMWITIQEPCVVCDEANKTVTIAPHVLTPDVGIFTCTKNVLMAHARAWRIYDKEFKPKYKGEVSLANVFMWFEGMTSDDEDMAELSREYMGGRYSHPIYSEEGGWPSIVEQLMANFSRESGYSRSILPAFTDEEITYIRGTHDFFGVNVYTSRLVRKPKDGEPPEHSVLKAIFKPHPDWKHGGVWWFYVNPPGMRKLLQWLRNKYGDHKFMIVENGYAGSTGLEDEERVDYIREHLKQILLAIKDGVNVTGYSVWSLMDNLEWINGFNARFGLYEVDFSSPNKTRTPRASAEFYKRVIQRHSLNV